MKALILGSKGQLGRGLAATAPQGSQLLQHDVDTLDITDADAVGRAVKDAAPDIVLNAAAYTSVDRAEEEEALAQAVNGDAVGHIAQATRDAGARFVHVSTDFVFDGTASRPYAPDAAPFPISAYGRTKLAGERLASNDALIVRTAWVYAPEGGNFVRTMLRLMGEREELGVVADQIGTPTYAPDLAAALWDLADKRVTGVHHYTDSGVASWYDFAVAIQEEALAIGLLTRAIPIAPIATSAYPTPAKRPHYSVLDKTSTIAALGRTPPHWRVNLRKMLNEIKTNG